MSVFARTDRSLFADWWWTIDRWLLLGLIVLIALGFLMSFAASPAVAQKNQMPIYHFANKQFVFLCAALLLGLGISLLHPSQIRVLAIALCAAALIAMVVTLFAGTTVKGATRWLRLGGFSLQPSEFLKPAFVVVTALLLAHQNTRFDSRGVLFAVGLWLIACALLMRQPDFGQSVLISSAWLCLYYLSGARVRVLAGLMVALALVSLFVYSNISYVAGRIDRFLDPTRGDTYQVDKAMDAIRSGGVFGAGLGDGRVKSILPDAHSDYVFAVAAEETGLVGGLTIIGIFALIVWRGLIGLARVQAHWIQLAVAGLICLFGVQVFINLGVNLNLLPSKGMTLPFISYGGSSLIASGIMLGMLIALTRRHAIAGPSIFTSSGDAMAWGTR